MPVRQPPKEAFPLPYLTAYLHALDGPDRALQPWLGRHFHWGFWPDPDRATLTPADFQQATDAMSRLVLAALSLAPGHRLLDVGCGVGGTMSVADAGHERLTQVGLNIDPRQLVLARRLVGSNAAVGNRAAFVAADACRLPLAAGTVDGISAVECIFHFPSRRQFFDEVFRVLKPGGRLVLTDFVFPPSRALAALALAPFYFPALVRTFGRGNRLPLGIGFYRWLAARSGLTCVSVTDVTAQSRPTYEAIRRFAPLLGESGATYVTANRFLELTTACGACRYMVLVFRKPALSPAGRS